MTALVELLAQETDGQNYTTYVFKVLDGNRFTKYIMCTRWPNWDHRVLNNGEIGYLSYKEIIAGIDKWFDGTNFIPYKYSNIAFERFVSKPKDETYDFKM